MSETRYSTERKLSGTARLFIGFVIGALFALAPMYYFYMGRDVALRGSNAAPDQVLTPSPEALRAATASGAGGGEKPFASRMTYELSRLPEEPLPVVAKAAPSAVAASPASASRGVPVSAPPQPSSAPRVVDARPINALPPDPRDRTGAIEKEAHKPEYREAARQEAPASAARPKVFEGREVELKAPRLPDTPTRPIMSAAVNTRAEIEAERARATADSTRSKTVAAGTKKNPDAAPHYAPGPPIAGVTPITRAAEKLPRQELVANANPAGTPSPSAPASANLGGESVQGRLASTREWLAGAAQTTHTIQLMGAGSEAQLEGQLKALARVLEPDRIRVFRTIAQGKPSITVVYGAYADRKSALQALEALPAAVAANRPVLRTVNGIRAEMKQHKTDG